MREGDFVSIEVGIFVKTVGAAGAGVGVIVAVVMIVLIATTPRLVSLCYC